jgi:iron complex outermembrane receptor protein
MASQTQYLVGASLAALMLAGSAEAQTAAASASTPPADRPGASGAEVGEILVTAQRREERLQSVPIAITALNSGQLQQAGITDVTRLEVLTPGLQVSATGSDSRPALRGVKTDNSRQAQADASVAYFIDGVYQSANQEALASFVDVARVEVDRGPQGTLFGRNSFGGDISVTTNLPTSRFEGSLEAEGGNFGENRFQGIVNIPVSDTLKFRFVGLTDNNDGYVRNLSPTGSRAEDKNVTYVRGVMKWDPTSKLDVVLRANYWSDGGHGGGVYEYKVQGIDADPANPANQSIYGQEVDINPRARAGDYTAGRCGNCTGPLADLANYPNGVAVPSDPWTINQDTPSKQRLEQYASTLEINYDLGFANLKSITAYNRFGDSDFTQYALRTVEQISHNETTTQELQLASARTRPFQWIVGGFFLRENASENFQQYGVTPAGEGAFGTGSYAVYDTTSYAGYAQASYFLTSQLRVTGGVRYTDDHKTTSGANFGPDANSDPGINVPIGGITPAQHDFTKVTYHASVDYQLTPEDLVYFSVSSGFRSGGFNTGLSPELAATFSTFAPETVTAYEVGAKTRFLDRRLLVNVSAFDNEYSSLQIVGFDPTTLATYTVNGGNAVGRGVEVEVVAVPVPNLNITANYAYLDAHWTQFVTIDPITYAGAYVGTGNEVAMSPKNRINLAADYTFDLGAAGRVTPRVATHYSSHYFLLDYNSAIERQNGYFKTDLSLRWTDPKDRYSIEGYVENVGNEAVKSGGEFGGRGAFFIGYEPPRTYGVKVGYRF